MKKNYYKYLDFVIFVLIVAGWSSTVSIYQFFMRSYLKNTTQINLEQITGYLSFGTSIAFLIATFLTSYFKLINIILACAISSLFLILIGIYGDIMNFYLFVLISIGIGFFYGIWCTIRNIFVSHYIKVIGWQDTTVNAIIIIIVTIFIIGGAYLGGMLYEKFNINGIIYYYYLLILIILLTILQKIIININQGTTSNQNKQFTSFQNYLINYKLVFQKYYFIIILISTILAISTLMCQLVIKISIDVFHQSITQSSLLQLIAAIGAIIGNIISIFLTHQRWQYFIFGNYLFGILVFIFPFIIFNYLFLLILTGILGIFFGILLNLIESYFFQLLIGDSKKDFSNSLYGIIVSGTLALFSFIIILFQNFGELNYIFFFFGILLILIGFQARKFN